MKTLTFQHLLLGIFAVANNFPALGPFLAICADLTKDKQQRLGKIATLTSFITMLLAMFSGQYILEFFGISLSAFKITGGLVLCMSGAGMLNSKTDPQPDALPLQDFEQKIPVAIVPIAVPLTTGAGTISTITIFAEQLHTAHDPIWGLLIAIIIMTIIIYVLFRYSTKLLDVLGHTGMSVLTKITGLFTLAIGIQFIVDGISVIFPGLIK